MKKRPDRVKHREHFSIYFTKKQAEIFLDMFGRDERFKDVCKDLDEGMKPILIYEVECCDCPRKFEIRVTEELDEKQIKNGGICVNCSDDYK